jgi:acetoin utilization deacetylase AcuC-like enzyme
LPSIRRLQDILSGPSGARDGRGRRPLARGGGELVAPREATHEQLARVHDVHYIQRISELRDRAVALDPDTYTSPETYEVALLAAGAAIEAVERTMSGSHHYTLAMMRPPGHHAEHAHSMGFCLFNNVAVAAAHARHALGAKRVAIVDYDVHHGNGTQHMFERDATVLRVDSSVSVHPGTGAVEEVGTGPGEGFTVNLPMESGGTTPIFRRRSSASPSDPPPVRSDLVLVSAGFDAHQRDPLATMRATEAGFAAMTMALRRVADECCQAAWPRRRAATTSGSRRVDRCRRPDACRPAAAPAWPSARRLIGRGRVAVPQCGRLPMRKYAS